VLAAFVRILLALAFAAAPVTMVHAMPIDEVAMSPMGDCPDMPSRPMASRDCALICIAALPAVVQIGDAPAKLATPPDPTNSHIGQPVESDVATPPPRFR
jgi:hypothetical protein